MKQTAVPVLNLPSLHKGTQEHGDPSFSSDRANRYKKREKKEEVENILAEHKIQESKTDIEETAIPDRTFPTEFFSQPSTSHNKEDDKLLHQYNNLKVKYERMEEKYKQKIKLLNSQVQYYKKKLV